MYMYKSSQPDHKDAQRRLGSQSEWKTFPDGQAGWMFQGRLLVIPDTSIAGRISVSVDATREALILDTNAPVIQEIYQRLRAHLQSVPAIFSTPQFVVWAIGQHVSDHVIDSNQDPMNAKASIEAFWEVIAEKEVQEGRSRRYVDVPVLFSTAVEARLGSSVYTTLLATALGQQLVSDGVIAGQFSYESGVDHESKMQHAFTRYTAPDGTLWICDPTQKIYGMLGNCFFIARACGRPWDSYAREEDGRQQPSIGKKSPAPLSFIECAIALVSISSLAFTYLFLTR